MIPLCTIYWDPKPEIFVIPYFDWPLLWYGVFFAAGFAMGFPLFVGILTRFLGNSEKKRALFIADQLTIYMVLGTVIGARLGHFLFYEHPHHYLSHPLEILCIWRGGLASHGAAIGIILALMVFSYRFRSKEPQLTWIRLLDFVCIPTALGAFCIRLGNFVNQEVLGKPTDLPWAITFGHPADFSPIVPRHPVQLYEAFFYLAVFCLLWKLSYKRSFLHAQGKSIGVFLILVFGFRFFIEFLKEEQSHLVASSPLSMGQMLSIPAILAGFIFYFGQKGRKKISEEK